jgi:GNAT superfamily N-acetyltransferase
MSIHIRQVNHAELETLTPALSRLLVDTVNGGSPMGFPAPFTREQARDYWLSVRPELLAGSRVLLVAFTVDGPAGSAQLELSTSPNGRHRAEIQKLFVSRALRDKGVGRALVATLHDTARARRRSLLLLNTRRGDPAEAFYKRLGYHQVGLIPGWTVGPTGERYDHVTLYQELGP